MTDHAKLLADALRKTKALLDNKIKHDTASTDEHFLSDDVDEALCQYDSARAQGGGDELRHEFSVPAGNIPTVEVYFLKPDGQNDRFMAMFSFEPKYSTPTPAAGQNGVVNIAKEQRKIAPETQHEYNHDCGIGSALSRAPQPDYNELLRENEYLRAAYNNSVDALNAVDLQPDTVTDEMVEAACEASMPKEQWKAWQEPDWDSGRADRVSEKRKYMRAALVAAFAVRGE